MHLSIWDKAFDRVPWEAVSWTLRKVSVEEWLVETVTKEKRDGS